MNFTYASDLELSCQRSAQGGAWEKLTDHAKQTRTRGRRRLRLALPKGGTGRPACGPTL